MGCLRALMGLAVLGAAFAALEAYPIPAGFGLLFAGILMATGKITNFGRSWLGAVTALIGVATLLYAVLPKGMFETTPTPVSGPIPERFRGTYATIQEWCARPDSRIYISPTDVQMAGIMWFVDEEAGAAQVSGDKLSAKVHNRRYGATGTIELVLSDDGSLISVATDGDPNRDEFVRCVSD